jgi:hypothetical protein
VKHSSHKKINKKKKYLKNATVGSGAQLRSCGGPSFLKAFFWKFAEEAQLFFPTAAVFIWLLPFPTGA